MYESNCGKNTSKKKKKNNLICGTIKIIIIPFLYEWIKKKATNLFSYFRDLERV